MSRIQFFTEGKADMTLLKILEVPPKLISDQGSNSSLAKAMQNQLNNYHKVIVGLTDKDKKNLPSYYSEFETIKTPDKITLKQKPNTNQYLIFLCCPALENWLLSAAEEAKIKPEDFNLKSDIKQFCRITKKDNVSKNSDFLNFLREIKKANPQPFSFLTEILDNLLKILNS